MSSVYGQIKEACKNAVLGISALGLTSTQASVRKRAILLPSDTLPMVLVVGEREALNGYDLNSTAYLDYPVIVVLVEEGNLLYLDPEWQDNARELIRERLLRVTLGTGAGVFDVVGYDPDPAFDLGGLDRQYDVSKQKFVYRAAVATNLTGV